LGAGKYLKEKAKFFRKFAKNFGKTLGKFREFKISAQKTNNIKIKI